jgi:hypothetical protein
VVDAGVGGHHRNPRGQVGDIGGGDPVAARHHHDQGLTLHDRSRLPAAFRGASRLLRDLVAPRNRGVTLEWRSRVRRH